MTIRPGTRTIVILAIILGLVIAGGGILCAMQLRDLGSHTDELNARKAKIVQESKLSKMLEDALADLEQSKRELEHLEQGVIEPDYIPTFLIQLDGLANRSGLTVEGVTVEEDKKAAAAKAPPKPQEGAPEGSERGVGSDEKSEASSQVPYTEQILSVEVKGAFDRVVEFVRKLTKFPKIVSVGDIKVSPSRERLLDGDPALDVTITLEAYIWRRAESAKKAGEGG